MKDVREDPDGGEIALPAPRRGKRVPMIIVGLLVLALAFGTFLVRRAESSTNRIAVADEPKGVTVVEARPTTFRETRRYVGTLEPWQEARVGPQLASGFVDTVLVRPGSVVKRGDVLATLDCRNASAGSAAIGYQARALGERQKAAAREAARLGELLDGGFAAANEVEQKLAQSAANDAQIQALLAQASGKSLEVGDCVLRAPFDGEVAARLVDPGSFVRPGTAIVHLVDRSVVRLSAYVPEIDFEAVSPKTAVKLHLLATGKTISGEVSRRAPSSDLATRTVRFEVDLANTDRSIPVGTTSEISVDVGAPKDAVEVPLLAAKIRGKKATLFVVEGSVAKKVNAVVLGERGSSLFLEPTLKRAAHVVTQGRSLLANDDRVTAKVESSAGPASSATPARDPQPEETKAGAGR